MLAAPILAYAGKPTDSKVMREIIDYFINQEYPEVINGKRYKVKAKGVVTGDINGDGREEVFLALRPHYRQMPSIIIFTRNKNRKLHRVKEGLAPGPLMPITGDYIDSHVLRYGIDITVKQNRNGEPPPAREIAEIGMQQKMHVVVYKKFNHMTLYEDNGGYIDMTHQNKYLDQESCGKFEFADLDGMKIGRLSNGGKRNYLVTVAANELNFYRIDGFTNNGFLEKQLWISPAPRNFSRLSKTRDGSVGFITKSGQYRSLALPTKKIF